MIPTPMADAGLALVRLGHVVRLAAGVKKPWEGSRGVNDATTNPETIAAWAAETPRANVAIAGGNGLIILDIDPRNGGDKRLAEIEARYCLPRTVTTITPGDGRTTGEHRYYRCHTLPNRQLGGIDIISTGKYALAPNSVTHAGVYRWAVGPDEAEVASLPAEVEAHLVELAGSRHGSFPIEIECDRLPVERQPLGERISAIIRDGRRTGHYRERDSQLAAVVTKMIACGWSFDEACDVILDPANAVGDKLRQWGQARVDRELRRTWNRCMAEVARIQATRRTGHAAIDQVAAFGRATASCQAVLHRLLDDATRNPKESQLAWQAGITTATVRTSCRTLAQDVGLTKDTVSRTLRRLEDAGLVERVEIGRYRPAQSTPSVYILRVPSLDPRDSELLQEMGLSPD